MRTSQALIELMWSAGESILDRIITMDEYAVSMHTTETKQQSKQWPEKGVPGPMDSKVHATMTKKMVLTFFDSLGVVYNHHVPKGKTVNSVSIVKMLQEFLRKLEKKRPYIEPGELVPELGQ
jgi:hypothetical protein